MATACARQSAGRRQFLRGLHLHNARIVYGGGALRPGRYVRHGARPATNLFVGLAHRLGLRQLERFGGLTGPLANL